MVRFSHNDPTLLPTDMGVIVPLVNIFFDRIHPLRCLGFIHRATFMHTLNSGNAIETYGEPLLLIILAFGAQISQLESAPQSQNNREQSRLWAKRCSDLIFGRLDAPNLRSLMVWWHL